VLVKCRECQGTVRSQQGGKQGGSEPQVRDKKTVQTSRSAGEKVSVPYSGAVESLEQCDCKAEQKTSVGN